MNDSKHALAELLFRLGAATEAETPQAYCAKLAESLLPELRLMFALEIEAEALSLPVDTQYKDGVRDGFYRAARLLRWGK